MTACRDKRILIDATGASILGSQSSYFSAFMPPGSCFPGNHHKIFLAEIPEKIAPLINFFQFIFPFQRINNKSRQMNICFKMVNNFKFLFPACAKKP